MFRISLLGFLVSLVAADGAAGVPVVGDVDLLRVIRDANSISTGDVSAVRYNIKIREGAGEKFREHASSGRCVQRGERRYWEYRVTEGDAALPPKHPGVNAPVDYRQVYDGEDMLSYRPPLGQAFLVKGFSIREMSIASRVMPDDLAAYFAGPRHHKDLGERALWSTVLDPDSPDPRRESFEVTADGNEVTVGCHYRSGSVLTVKASLALGGRVTSYQYESVPTALTRTGKLTWTNGKDGQPVLTGFRLFYQFYSEDGSEEGFFEQTNELEHLDAAEVPGAVFDTKDVDLAGGTRVVVRTVRGKTLSSYVAGQADPNAELDRLANELGADGFAAEEASD